MVIYQQPESVELLADRLGLQVRVLKCGQANKAGRSCNKAVEIVVTVRGCDAEDRGWGDVGARGQG